MNSTIGIHYKHICNIKRDVYASLQIKRCALDIHEYIYKLNFESSIENCRGCLFCRGASLLAPQRHVLKRDAQALVYDICGAGDRTQSYRMETRRRERVVGTAKSKEKARAQYTV